MELEPPDATLRFEIQREGRRLTLVMTPGTTPRPAGPPA
jgi:hypothetical protein